MKILVTGGAGFIASHLVDGLIDDGHVVAVLDNFSTGTRANVHSSATVFEADLTNRDDVVSAVKGFEPEAVYHYAAQVSVPLSFQDPVLDCSSNVVGMLNLITAFRAISIRPRFIFASSGGAVYGNASEFPSSETTTPHPATPYGVSKLACEHYLSILAGSDGFETVILRFSNVYGPRQGSSKETGVCAVFLKQARCGAPLTVFGDGGQTRDYVYVGDLTRAAKACLEKGSGATVNLSTGTETSTLELAKIIQTIANPVPEIQFLPERPGDVARSCLNSSRAKELLAWEPRINLKEGLELTLAEQVSTTASN